MKIAIQGQAGSFHDQAARLFFGADSTELITCKTFAEVFAAVESGDADAGMAAIENSLYGSIRESHDLLMQHDLTIVGEVSLPIHQQLIASQPRDLDAILHVYSHPAALDQCRNFLRTKLPQAEAIEWFDTAGAVQHLRENPDEPWAAIAGTQAANLYTAPILAQDIEDETGNVTRFLALARPGELTPQNPNKASLNLITPHQSGSLHRALGVFERHNANLTKLESRPVRGQPFKYQFFVAVETDPTTLDQIVTELTAQQCQVRVLGTYIANGL